MIVYRSRKRALNDHCFFFFLSHDSFWLQEFPFDPVTAEDGHVYEKTAIQSFFETKPGDKIPSPMTQVQMGKTLLPAPKMKNHIESMVMNGYIQGPLADKWKELFVTKTTVDAIMEKALKKQRLSPVQMKMLGEWCVKGSLELGIKKDFPMALQMFQTLHAMGDPEGTAFLGRMFYKGLGTTADVQKGLVYLGMARAQGSSLGAYYLAECFARPKFGLPVDVAEALFCHKLSLRFIQRGENFRRGLTPQEVNKARKRIAELVPLASSTSD